MALLSLPLLLQSIAGGTTTLQRHSKCYCCNKHLRYKHAGATAAATNICATSTPALLLLRPVVLWRRTSVAVPAKMSVHLTRWQVRYGTRCYLHWCVLVSLSRDRVSYMSCPSPQHIAPHISRHYM
jgi:hypothetical protein